MLNVGRQGGDINYKQKKLQDNFWTVFINKTAYGWNENNKIADFIYVHVRLTIFIVISTPKCY